MRCLLLLLVPSLMWSQHYVVQNASGNATIPYVTLGPYVIQPAANKSLLPAASAGNAGYITIISDGTSSSDCTVGGGSSISLCRSTGSVWASIGGGGGGGSPAFGSITTGSNTSATMTVGTGASLVPTGSGAINATKVVDSNQNNAVTVNTTTNAVDNVQVTNAATANPATVTITAVGSDSNINLNLVSKGSGTVQCNGTTCGTGGTGQAANVVTIASTTGTVAFNCTSSSAGTVTIFQASAGNPITLTGNLTMTSSGCTQGQIVAVYVNSGTAPYTITPPTGWDLAQVIQVPSTSTLITWQIGNDGNGKLVDAQASGGVGQSSTTTAPVANPPSNYVFSWCDSSANTCLVKDSSGNLYAAVKTAAGRVSNQFITYINPQGVPQTAAIALADLPAGATQTIASGTAAMGTGSISSGACASAVTVSATGVATTDAIVFTPNADPTGVTGYAPSSSGSLYIWAYPTANNVNFKVCNNTSSSVSPSALTLNWRVTR